MFRHFKSSRVPLTLREGGQQGVIIPLNNLASSLHPVMLQHFAVKIALVIDFSAEQKLHNKLEIQKQEITIPTLIL